MKESWKSAEIPALQCAVKFSGNSVLCSFSRRYELKFIEDADIYRSAEEDIQ